MFSANNSPQIISPIGWQNSALIVIMFESNIGSSNYDSSFITSFQSYANVSYPGFGNIGDGTVVINNNTTNPSATYSGITVDYLSNYIRVFANNTRKILVSIMII